MTLLQLAIFGLATWRVASLFTREKGPFHIFEKLRIRTGIVHDANTGDIEIIPSRFFAEVLSCMWCSSIYIGLFWTGFYLLFPTGAFWTAIVFACSTLVIIIETYIHRK